MESSLFQEVWEQQWKQHHSHVVLQNLKLQTPRQVDLNFEDLIKKFKNRHEKYKEILQKEKYITILSYRSYVEVN